jgi:hypothetical protein
VDAAAQWRLRLARLEPELLPERVVVNVADGAGLLLKVPVSGSTDGLDGFRARVERSKALGE